MPQLFRLPRTGEPRHDFIIAGKEFAKVPCVEIGGGLDERCGRDDPEAQPVSGYGRCICTVEIQILELPVPAGRGRKLTLRQRRAWRAMRSERGIGHDESPLMSLLSRTDGCQMTSLGGPPCRLDRRDGGR